MQHAVGQHVVAAVAVSLLGLVACGGAIDSMSVSTTTPPGIPVEVPPSATVEVPPSSSTTTSAPNEPVGVAWQEERLDLGVSAVAVVGDRLWVAGQDAAGRLVLVSTTDGRAWTPIDLEALGIAMDSELFAPGSLIGQAALASIDGELVGMLAARPQPGVSVEGVGADLWVVTTAGAADGGVRVMGPEETGLDQRLDGPRNFRITNLGGIAGLDDQVHVVADGQWWIPYETSDSDFATMSLLGGDSWTTHSVDEEPLGFLNFAGVETLDDRVVAVVWRSNKPRRLVSYVTTDGVSWIEGGHPPAEGEWVEVSDVAVGAGRIVAVGSELRSWDAPMSEDFPVAFWSEDGLTWNRVEMPGELDTTPGVVVWTGQEFLALGDATRRLTTVWTSADGVDWTVATLADSASVWANHIVMWKGRAVLFGGGRVAFSPPLG